MDKDEAFERAVNGAHFIASLVRPSGKFVYGIDTNGEALKGYNILRHAGSVWALLTVAEVTYDTTLIDKAKLALEWVIKKRMQTFVDGSGSSQSSTMVFEGKHAKLGGAGLGALALVKFISIRPNKKFFEKAIELCNYIAYDCITKTGKPIFQKRDVVTGKDTGFFSDFYPGEAALALLEVNKFIHDSDFFKETAGRIIEYMYQLREKKGHVRDHWMMQAIEQLGLGRGKGYAHKIAIETRDNPLSIKSGPTACRSEALLSYYKIVNSRTVRKKVLKHVEMLLERQAKCQVKKGRYKGGFLWSPKDHTLRNDVTQHNISSFIRFWRVKVHE